jgi:hypothetical protein
VANTASENSAVRWWLKNVEEGLLLEKPEGELEYIDRLRYKPRDMLMTIHNFIHHQEGVLDQILLEMGGPVIITGGTAEEIMDALKAKYLPGEESKVSSNREIVDACSKMKIGETLDFITDHTLQKLEVALLVKQLSHKRKVWKKGGMVILVKDDYGFKTTIHAVCQRNSYI